MEQGRAPSDDELVFVSGHPGRTDRLNTVAHLEYLRDRVFPQSLDMLRRREVLLRTYSERGVENARRAQDELFGDQNSRKARLGRAGRPARPGDHGSQAQGRDAACGRPWPTIRSCANARDAWDEVDAALGGLDADLRRLRAAASGARRSTPSCSASPARWCGWPRKRPSRTPSGCASTPKPDSDSLKQQLFSEAPIYDDLETVKLADSLGYLMERAGADNRAGQADAGRQVARAAGRASWSRGTKLADVAVRKKLAEGGKQRHRSSDDPMIALARLVDGPAREVRKTYEDKVEEPLRQAYAKIAKARFAIDGDSTYPDATFTLRLAFGAVKGYEEDGKKVPPWTTIGGAYRARRGARQQAAVRAARSAGSKTRTSSNLDTPFNFVCTADIIGGNSGSPVVNRAGEVVGIIFDGNIQSLVLDFVYTDEEARAVAVHSSAIIEALRKVYDAGPLADELTGK